MEKWLPVVGYEGLYEVSDLGNVKALERTHAYRGSSRTYAAKLLKPAATGSSDLFSRRISVCLTKDGRQKMRAVSNLVLEAHVGPRPVGAVARHYPDRDPWNCALANLSWATQSQNMLDKRTHGTDHQVSKMHCPQGHPYEGENLIINSKGRRECRVCKNESNRRYRERTIY